MKNVLLHGCIDYKSSNYGDYLFADIVYHYIIKNFPDLKVKFYDISPFCREKLKDYTEWSFSPKEADCLVYLPGGYMGEPAQMNPKILFMHYYRFFRIGLKMACMKKNILIMGMGAGPFYHSVFTKTVKYIMRASKTILVRDKESADYLKDIQITNTIQLSDLVLSIDAPDCKEPLDEINRILQLSAGKKLLLVHYHQSERAVEHFRQAIKKFLICHPDYYVVVTSDCLVSDEAELYSLFACELKDCCTLYHYDDPWGLCYLIKQCDFIITTKLHVGITAARYLKSVVSFPIHYEKTRRFYRQLGEAERCVDLEKSTAELVYEQMERYHDRPICLSDELISLSKMNYIYLGAFLNES